MSIEKKDNWIWVEDLLPEYNVQVLVYRLLCDRCFQDQNDDHSHRLVYNGEEITTAFYLEKDLDLVKYYNKKNDYSWDWATVDHWSIDKVIAWMPLPEPPKPKERNNK